MRANTKNLDYSFPIFYVATNSCLILGTYIKLCTHVISQPNGSRYGGEPACKIFLQSLFDMSVFFLLSSIGMSVIIFLSPFDMSVIIFSFCALGNL